LRPLKNKNGDKWSLFLSSGVSSSSVSWTSTRESHAQLQNGLSDRALCSTRRYTARLQQNCWSRNVRNLATLLGFRGPSPTSDVLPVCARPTPPYGVVRRELGGVCAPGALPCTPCERWGPAAPRRRGPAAAALRVSLPLCSHWSLARLLNSRGPPRDRPDKLSRDTHESTQMSVGHTHAEHTSRTSATPIPLGRPSHPTDVIRYGALEPHLGQRTLEIHHDKHHAK
jgi:hypothetical protein